MSSSIWGDRSALCNVQQRPNERTIEVASARTLGDGRAIVESGAVAADMQHHPDWVTLMGAM